MVHVSWGFLTRYESVLITLGVENAEAVGLLRAIDV